MYLVPCPHPLQQSGSWRAFLGHWESRSLFGDKVLHFLAVIREYLTHPVHGQLVIVLQVLVHVILNFFPLRLISISILLTPLNDVLVQDFLGFGINLGSHK